MGYYSSVYIVLETPINKWKWWPALQLVERTPKGKRKPDISIPLSIYNNNERMAILIALREELKRRREALNV